MGLYDRRYMRDVPIYRQLTGRTESPAESVSRTRPWAWILLGVIATLGAIALLTPLVRHGLSPANPLAAPAPQVPYRRRITHLRGPKTLAYGTHVTLTGHSAQAPGQITVLGRWNNGPWHFLAIGNAAGRRYRFGIAIDHHGRLDLRVVQPNGDFSWGTYRIVDGSPADNPVT